MRIPPSAIVLPLILAVPFGLAIRDSVKGNDRASEEARAAKDLAELDAQQASARVAAEQDQYERTKRLEGERGAALAVLIGREPATFGSAIAPEQLGELTSLAPSVSSDIHVSAMRSGDGKVTDLAITIDTAACRAMHDMLVAAWGEGQRPGNDPQLWTDAAHHQRASLSKLPSEWCALHFDRMVDDIAWVELALPKILGKPVTQVEKLFGPPVESYVDVWVLPGPSIGYDASLLTVTAGESGKVEHTTVAISVPDEEAAALVNLISKKLGRQPTHDEESIYQWGDHVVLSYADHHLELSHDL
ncbi:hypothetical protein BH11MYX1_BH11MYX1_03370 [soil metagenome]